ncbi:MAG: T9SS type A sorting domain-containing protein [Bacteroidia bacterium]
MYYKTVFASLLILGFISTCSFAQLPNHISNWSTAGNYNKLNSKQTIKIDDFNSDNLGNKENNSALRRALNSLGNKGGIIEFGKGTYLFIEGINIPSNVHLVGKGVETSLAFELSSEMDAISFKGNIELRKYKLNKAAFRGNKSIELKETDNLSSGDLIKLSLPNSGLTSSPWAQGSVGQITKIVAVNGKSLILEDELRINFLMADAPIIEKVLPVKNAGLSCIQLITQDETKSNSSIIKMEYAENCYARNISSEYSNLAHVEIDNSYRIEIIGSFFRFAHDFTKGGKANGVLIRNTSSNCLVENNIFTFLAHAMVVEAGANGNVFAYNYSSQTYWEKEGEESNNSADILVNGNYPFANLFEGNVVQNIVVAANNGKNGPNSFYMNWAELFGFRIEKNAGDSFNLIKNRITNNLPQFGKVQFSGNGHYENRTLWLTKLRVDSISDFTRKSLYINDSIKFTGGAKPYRNFAEKRDDEKVYVQCADSSKLEPNGKVEYEEMVSINSTEKNSIQLYPNPVNDVLYVKVNDTQLTTGSIIDQTGKIVMLINKAEIDVSTLENGLYFIQLKNEEGMVTERLVIIH